MLSSEHISELTDRVYESHMAYGVGAFMVESGEPVPFDGDFKPLTDAPVIETLGRELRRKKDIRKLLYEARVRKLVAPDTVILSVYDKDEDVSSLTLVAWEMVNAA